MHDQFSQWPCEVPEIQYFDWQGETVCDTHDLQATPVSTQRCKPETSWQLEAACTGLWQHYPGDTKKGKKLKFKSPLGEDLSLRSKLDSEFQYFLGSLDVKMLTSKNQNSVWYSLSNPLGFVYGVLPCCMV
jgi:hypothetical protein